MLPVGLPVPASQNHPATPAAGPAALDAQSINTPVGLGPKAATVALVVSPVHAKPEVLATCALARNPVV